MGQISDHLHISDLIVKKLLYKQIMTEEEDLQLREWLNKSEKNRIFYARMADGRIYDYCNKTLSDINQSTHWKQVDGATRSVPKRKYPVWYACVASITLLFLLSIMLYRYGNLPQNRGAKEIATVVPGKNQAVLILDDGQQIALNDGDTLLNTGHSQIKIETGQAKYNPKEVADTTDSISYNTIIVPRSGIFSLVLSDGSTIFLNSESELTYPVIFAGETREIFLKGEAYFEVKHLPEKPFVVHTGKVKTKVLGTTFNIMAYHDEPEIQTTLISGSVEVTIKETTIKKILTSGMQSAWNETTGKMSVKNVESRVYSIWKDGIIMLKGESLESVVRMLSRWYDVSYVYIQELSAKHSFTGKIDRNESLNDVLNTLTLLGGPRFELKNNTIYIY